MGFLRKTVKKIGKAIKKVVKKVGKAFGKLGIVGQIGMMFLMPHLGAMWGNIGSWAAQGSNILQKAVGVIHKAGTAIGNTYKTVTEAIGNGFDRAKNFMKGDGLVLSPERTPFFGADAKLAKAETKYAKLTDGDTLFDPVKEVKEKVTEKVVEEVTQPSILDKVKDKVIDSTIQGVGDRFRNVAAGEPPVQRVNQYVNTLDTGSLPGLSGGTGVAGTVDFTRQSFQMNNWQDIASIYSPQVNQRLG
tara:strand:- start:104 stop:841 length:738 start_codon:yes stop_codon:yes gene_type:complete